MPSNCSYRYQSAGEDIPCKRSAYGGRYCILHLEDRDKPLELFQTTIQTELDDPSATVLDLRGATIADLGAMFHKRAISKDVLFDRAYFFELFRIQESTSCNRLSFNGAIFEKKVTISHCHFESDLSFHHCEFRAALLIEDTDIDGQLNLNAKQGSSITVARIKVTQDMRFEGVTLTDTFTMQQGLSHEGTVFSGGAVFRYLNVPRIEILDTTFNGRTMFDVNGVRDRLHFVRTHFLGETFFDGDKPQKAVPEFINCNMQLVTLSSLPVEDTDTNLTFEDCIWPRKKYFWGLVAGRRCIADEVIYGAGQKLVRLYHRLHRHYYNKHEYTLASEFYVSYMVTKRKVRKGNRWARLFDYSYSLLSRYGESIKRPLLPLLLMWFIVPAVLCALNLVTAEAFESAAGTTDVGPNGPTYWQMFMANLSWTSVDRSGLSKLGAGTVGHAIIFGEMLLNVLFLAFLALGVRRTFVPKKPLDKA